MSKKNKKFILEMPRNNKVSYNVENIPTGQLELDFIVQSLMTG